MIIRCMSFDPGAGAMGVAVIDYDTDTGKFKVVDTMTVEGKKLLKQYKELRANFADSFCIQHAYYHLIVDDLYPKYKPDLFVSEGAFHHKFVATLISLTLIIGVIRRASQVCLGIDVGIVAPMETKKLIAQKSMANKDEIKAAILGNTNIIFEHILLPDELTEHEFDAVGHGCAYIMKNLLWLLRIIRK